MEQKTSYRIEIQIMQSMLMSFREVHDASNLLWNYGKIAQSGYSLPTPCRLSYERAECIHAIIYLRGLMTGAYTARKWLTRSQYVAKSKKPARKV